MDNLKTQLIIDAKNAIHYAPPAQDQEAPVVPVVAQEFFKELG